MWCRHRKQTSPRRDERGEYCRCLDCGTRLPWSWSQSTPVLRPPRLVQPSVTSSSPAQRLTVVWNAAKKSA